MWSSVTWATAASRGKETWLASRPCRGALMSDCGGRSVQSLTSALWRGGEQYHRIHCDSWGKAGCFVCLLVFWLLKPKGIYPWLEGGWTSRKGTLEEPEGRGHGQSGEASPKQGEEYRFPPVACGPQGLAVCPGALSSPIGFSPPLSNANGNVSFSPNNPPHEPPIASCKVEYWSR